jgi:hypothetical protein
VSPAVILSGTALLQRILNHPLQPRKPLEKRAHMNLFKTFTLKWWQAGLFKWGMLALGIAIGTYWHDFFGGYLLILVLLAVVSLTYVTYVWGKQ